jgi:azurin
MNVVLKGAVLFFLSLAAGVTHAACSFDIEVGDYLRFSSTEMVVEKGCGSVTVNLKHSGQLPEKIMGHNWVLTKSSDVQPVATAGMSAGLASEYVPQGDERVIAFSEVIGGGETTSVSFSSERLVVGRGYTFFCSFPGHSYSMRGTLKVI